MQALAISEPGLQVEEMSFDEPLPLPADTVEVEVHACALSGADAQQLRGEWGPCLLPLVQWPALSSKRSKPSLRWW